MSKPFFFRIESADLLNFATDPEGEGMTLLRFAKELQKGKSDIEFIQGIIDETVEFSQKKRDAANKRWKAKDMQTDAVHSTAMPEAVTEAVAVTIHKPKTLKKAEKISLPDFITESTWDEFKKMRVGLKKKMTPAAEKRMINKLTKANEDGHDVEKMLDQSILNSWSDVYEPKSNRSDKPKQQASRMPGINY